MSTKTNGGTRVIHRNSEDGKLVTEDYAKKHPATTERERVKIPPPQPSQPKKK